MSNMFGERLYILRKKHQLTQLELAEAFSVSRSTIAVWEKNDVEPDYAMLVKIANYFDISTDYLLGISDNPARSNPDAGKGPYNIGLAGDTQSLTKEEINAIKAVLDAFRSTKK